jgi:hypothetical protein
MAKTMKKMLTIPGHKEGNSNKNHTKIPPHFCEVAITKNANQ